MVMTMVMVTFLESNQKNTININLYHVSQCPLHDSAGRIELSSYTVLLRNDYSAGENSEKYVRHG
jgi:hypothetical protein